MLERHAIIERSGPLLLVLILITVSIGGLVEIVPLFTIESTIEKVQGVLAYSPLNSPAATSTSARAATTATAR